VVRQGKVERTGRRRRGWAHWWRRNQPEMPTVVRSSDEQSLGIDDGSGEEEKRDEGGGPGLLIGGLAWRES
jgi:hypothetical protein